jgi:16S rRNA (guanine527-N7)-methyltransferase
MAPSASSAGGELQALVTRYGLTEAQRSRLEQLLDRLAGDNRAPTTVRDRGEALRRHLADSLVGLEVGAVREARAVADLGSGAGLPGLVLATALPEAHVWLVESQQSKCSFIAGLVAALELENATVVCARAEDWPEGIESHDLVVTRALAPQAVALEYAAPLLRIGGSLVEWRGRRSPEEEAQADRAAAELGLRRGEIARVEPFAAATDRHLHVFEKTSATPERFPRRPGVASKRPLGA